ncbi:MAG: hypothetical protein KDB02_04240 [Acidimicrobiales bacterium]|nr:hypothetical protein [Acidimicrobiales bacterium]
MPTATKTTADKATTTTSGSGTTDDGLQGLVKGIQANETSALQAIKRFVDTVNEAFPDITEDGPRQKVIDAAFKMTQQVVDASNQLAINIIDVTENALDGRSPSAN